MLVYIQYNNKQYPITVEEKEIIAELKIKIETFIGISTDRIELYHDTILLDSNSHTLQSYHIVNESVITIKLLPPQIKTTYLFPSITIFSICAILMIYFSTEAKFLPDITDPIDMTALIANCILICWFVAHSLFSIVFDNPIKKSIDMTKAILISVSSTIIVSFVIYEVNYNRYQTSPLGSIIGAIFCINCLMMLLYQHYQLSKCYNELGDMIKYPSVGLFKIISCPNHLFEGLFFTAFAFCCNFTMCSVIFCIINWIVMMILARSQLHDYQMTFKNYKISKNCSF